MVYIQQNTPPPSAMHPFELNVFTGGLNNQSRSIENHQSSLSYNMAFSDDVVMEKRKGTKKFDELFTNEPITHISQYEPYQNERILMRGTKTRLYAEDVEITAVNGNIQSTNYSGYFFFADGDVLRVYGSFPQTSNTYTALIGTPVVENKVMTVVTPPREFTPLDTSHTMGVTYYDYDNGRVWYEPCQLEMEDSYKGANVVPSSPSYIVSHKDRIYVSGVKEDNDNVFLTDLQNPFYFPVALPMQPTPNADKVVGLAVYDDSVVVGRKEDIHVINGNTNRLDVGGELFHLRKLNTHTGFANQNSVNVAHNYLFFLGSDGVAYNLSSVNQSERILVTNVLSSTIDLFKKPLGFTLEEIETATSIFYDGEWYLSIKDQILVYSYRHRAWTTYNNLHVRSFCKLPYELLMGTSSGKTIHFVDNYYLDDGVPYLARWVSKNFDMGQASTFKHFREFFLVAHVFDDFNSDVRIKFEVDYIDVRDINPISNEMSRWGESKWGDRYITRNINTSFPIVIGRRGRYIRFIFSNSWDVQATVHSVNDLPTVSERRNNETLVYVTLSDAYYLYRDGEWVEMSATGLNQPMKVYELNGDYVLRGKR